MYWLKKKTKTRTLVGSSVGLSFTRFKALAAVISFGLSAVYPRGLTTADEYNSVIDNEHDEDDDEDEEDMLHTDYMMSYRSGKYMSVEAEQAKGRDKKTDVKQALDMSDRKEILKEHNRQRRNVTPPAANMVYMVWSLELEKSAREISRECREIQSIPVARKKLLLRFFSFTGVNVYQKKKRKLAVTAAQRAMGKWIKQSVHYHYDWNSCKLGQLCNSFLKMIWGEASHIGCSLKVCAEYRQLNSGKPAANREFVVCIYGGGHELQMRHHQPYIPGDPCSLCPTGFTKCVDGLCQTEPECQTVVDCPDVADLESCLCDASVYKSGQQRVARRLTPLDLSSVTETVVLLLLCYYLLSQWIL